jgi:hypothetical protein
MARKSDKTDPSSEPSADGEAPKSAGLPMFFTQPRPLDIRRHAQAAIRPGSDFGFARDTNSILLNAVEFIEAARHYPIVFTNDEQSLPAAIVGLERGNYFVEGSDWKPDTYIPAYVRQYPFVFLERPQEDKFYLCIDEGAPQFSMQAGEGAMPLYKEDGSPSPLTQNALQFCAAFYNHFRITRNFCEDLKKHGLLSAYQSDATLPSGRSVQLSGFLMIDEKALNQLSNEVFLEFRKKGWLPFIYFALSSGANWKRLLWLAGQSEPAARQAKAS